MSVEDPCVIFGSNLRSIRESKGISQEELAELADLDRTYVSGVERGKRNISLRNIYKLASALNLPAHKLLKTI